jgi:ketosteroid isomerase-like protein
MLQHGCVEALMTKSWWREVGKIRYPHGYDCRDEKMSASFPLLERFTDQLGKTRQRLSLMLCGLFLFPATTVAKPEAKKPVKKEVVASKSAAKTKSGLKGECKHDNTVECWNALAVSHARQGRLEEARLALESAFQADPQLMALRGNLEKLYGNLARQAYDSALGLSRRRNEVELVALPEPKTRLRSDRQAHSTPAEVAVLAPVPERIAAKAVAPVAQALAVPEIKVATLPAVKPKPKDTARDSNVVPNLVVARIPKPLPLVPVPAVVSAVRKDSIKVVPTPAKAVVAKAEPKPVAVVAKPVASAAPKIPVAVLPLKPAKIKEQVRKALEAWGANWSAKDVDGYLSWYAPEFIPASAVSRSAWETLRRERITAPASIEVTLESVRIEPDDSGRVASQFLQSYRTESVRLRSRKRLLWKQIDGAWKIVSEGEVK